MLPTTTYIATNPSIITNGLKSYWQFENPNCFLGIISGNPASGRTFHDLTNPAISGSVGSLTYIYNVNSGSFRSNALARLKVNNTGLKNFTEWSINFWTGNVAAGVQCGQFENGDNTFPRYSCTLYNNNGGHTGIDCIVYNAALVGLVGYSSNVANVTGWHNYALTYTKNTDVNGSGSVSYYQDGNFLNTVSGFPPTEPLVGNLMDIGHNTLFNGNHWMNMMALYDRPLSTDEVLYNYNATKWRFNF
jgi:hypothetical protein